jgi:hypothetical protein
MISISSDGIGSSIASIFLWVFSGVERIVPLRMCWRPSRMTSLRRTPR